MILNPRDYFNEQVVSEISDVSSQTYVDGELGDPVKRNCIDFAKDLFSRLESQGLTPYLVSLGSSSRDDRQVEAYNHALVGLAKDRNPQIRHIFENLDTEIIYIEPQRPDMMIRQEDLIATYHNPQRNYFNVTPSTKYLKISYDHKNGYYTQTIPISEI